MNTFFTFLNMGGYAVYVWSAYGMVLGILTLQLLAPWLRWRRINKKKMTFHDAE